MWCLQAWRLNAVAVPLHDVGGTDDPRGTASSRWSNGRAHSRVTSSQEAEATRRCAVALARQGGWSPRAALVAPRAASVNPAPPHGHASPALAIEHPHTALRHGAEAVEVWEPPRMGRPRSPSPVQ
jgi:hypothetical protein